jgi:L-alanine-DL-glutamate epimerase-like enolase superfamily enzyme
LTGAPLLSVEEVQLFEWPFVLRLPFRFGVITVTEGRQAVVRLRIRTENGHEGWGVAAESLAAKWFDKDPRWTDEQNLDQLRAALEIAVARYRAAGLRTAFAHFADGYDEQIAEGERLDLKPLVAGYGPALLDRAVLDALCRIAGLSFYEAMRRNLPGMTAHPVLPDLAGFDFATLLRGLAPADDIAVRHTVGLVDPITASDQAPGTRVEDGLPETLEEVVETYEGRYYKLKVGGDVAADVARLAAIAGVLDRMAEPYYASLDGNEQYSDAASVLALWEAMEQVPALGRLRRSILFIEQPIKRAAALAESVAALAARRPVIIDESDGELDAFPRAKALGYAGVSSKTCKGLYKSLANLARCRKWNDEAGAPRYFLSGEDLTTLAGIAVQQDLALVNLLGLTHVERNGHHFVDGFNGRPAEEAEGFLAAHPALYHRQNGQVRLRVARGRLALQSLACPGFASGALPDFAAMAAMPRSAWRGAT